MTKLIRSEFLKIGTTRTVYTFLAAMLALVAFGVITTLGNDPDGRASIAFADQEFLFVAGSMPWLFVLVLGLRAFTDEFRHGSIIATLLGHPKRHHVLFAKVATVVVWGLVFEGAAYALALAIGVPQLASESIAVEAGALATVIGKGALIALLWSALGVGLGLAVRYQVAGIVGTFVWLFVVENFMASHLAETAKYFPIMASNALIGIEGGEKLSPLGGGVALGVWTIAATVLGALLMHRRDIA